MGILQGMIAAEQPAFVLMVGDVTQGNLLTRAGGYWFDDGNTRLIAISDPYTHGAGGPWADWCANVGAVMSEARGDPAIRFIVTFGHRPVYSSGNCPPGDPLTLRGYLDALGGRVRQVRARSVRGTSRAVIDAFSLIDPRPWSRPRIRRRRASGSNPWRLAAGAGPGARRARRARALIRCDSGLPGRRPGSTSYA